MILILGLGLVALAVLALAVGLFDAAQAGERRRIARDRRAAWEQRQHEERMALARERFPHL
jgi:hypothetical protein